MKSMTKKKTMTRKINKDNVIYVILIINFYNNNNFMIRIYQFTCSEQQMAIVILQSENIYYKIYSSMYKFLGDRQTYDLNPEVL